MYNRQYSLSSCPGRTPTTQASSELLVLASLLQRGPGVGAFCLGAKLFWGEVGGGGVFVWVPKPSEIQILAPCVHCLKTSRKPWIQPTNKPIATLPTKHTRSTQSQAHFLGRDETDEITTSCSTICVVLPRSRIPSLDLRYSHSS